MTFLISTFSIISRSPQCDRNVLHQTNQKLVKKMSKP